MTADAQVDSLLVGVGKRHGFSLTLLCFVFGIWLALRSAAPRPVLSLTLLLLATIWIALLERWLPLRSDWKPSGTDLKFDAVCMVVTVLCAGLGDVLTIALYVRVAQLVIDFTGSGWVARLPFAAQVGLALYLSDFAQYWYHRYSHVGAAGSALSMFAWRTHSMHHVPRKLYGFNNSRMHPLNLIGNRFMRLLPVLVFGFDADAIFASGMASTLVSYLAHANAALDTRGWDRIILTPALHRFHHSTVLEQAKNHGNTVMFWDQLFGSYVAPSKVGTPQEVGVAVRAIYPLANDLVPSLLFPVKRGHLG